MKQKNKIEFIPATITYSFGQNELFTKFSINVKIGDTVFYGRGKFDTEEEAQKVIDVLKDNLIPKPKTKTKRIGIDTQTGKLKEI